MLCGAMLMSFGWETVVSDEETVDIQRGFVVSNTEMTDSEAERTGADTAAAVCPSPRTCGCLTGKGSTGRLWRDPGGLARSSRAEGTRGTNVARRRKASGERDLREVPMYTLAEAAHHLGLPRATLRSWVHGRKYTARGEQAFSPGIIMPPDHPADDRLSFTNLVEAHVLRALRFEHDVPMKLVRRALEYAEREFRIERLLISDQLCAAPGEMFLKEYGRLLSLTVSGQLAIERVLESFLRRLARDIHGVPIRLYPFVGTEVCDDRRVVTIDPRISYGRPSLAGKGISTAILAERVNGGEEIDDLAVYYWTLKTSGKPSSTRVSALHDPTFFIDADLSDGLGDGHPVT